MTLADELHKPDAALPFTVSDLFTDNATHFWMRVTGFDARIGAALEIMAHVLPGRSAVDGWNGDFALLMQHDWTATTTYEAFVRDHWKLPDKHRLALEFITPTALKSVGVSRPFPDPALVFRLLYERLLKLDGLHLPFAPEVATLETFAHYYVEIAGYEINYVEVEMKGLTKAFCGAVGYHVVESNDAFEKRAQTWRDKHADASLIAVWDDIRQHHGQYARLLNRITGHNKRGELRYRHAEGVSCGSHTRSLRIEIIERELRLLIEHLTLKEESFAMLVELAIQSEHGGSAHTANLEKEKEAAIAKCRRRIEAAKAVFLDGDMPREEYTKIKEENEREIAHWQARTTETEKAAVELRMCLNVVNQIIELWDTSKDEDRQQMAHMLFDYIVYDLDRRQIVDFRLKAWADRYLVLRTDLFGDDELPEESGENQNGTSLKESTDLCPIGGMEARNDPHHKSSTDLCPIGDSNPCFSLERATS